jgi:hypothetical protein
MQNLDKYFARVDELRETFTTPRDVPAVAFTGPYNTGKSTLINNMLGQQISPVDIIPTTSSLIRFSYGERFLARVHYTGRRVTALTVSELAGLLAKKQAPGREIQKVDVQFKHALLQRLHLIDSPGTDAVNGPPSLPGGLKEADHIVYLLHQRGPGEADRIAIRELVEHRGAARVSFWINCNLGRCDGSSLEESRRVLREICGGEITVYLINTMDPGDVEKFRYFIEDRAATTTLQRVNGKLKELDSRIPGLVAGSLRESGDSAFLVKFWEARECARRVIHGQNLVKSIPPVSQQIRTMLEKSTATAKPPGGVQVVYATAGRAPDPGEVRSKIKSLLEGIMADRALSSCPGALDELKALAARLDREQYLVTAAGGFSSGKSTFFNAIMGENLLPAENRPTTFAITLLKHGAVKKATVTYARRVVIPTHYRDGDHIIICRHELATLERWLTDPGLSGPITALEQSKNGVLSGITAAGVLRELEQLKTAFARVKRSFHNGKRPWKSLFKKIPVQKFTGSNLADAFIVHFQNAEKTELNLETGAGRLALAEIAGSHLALRVKNIEISHPAELLRAATFVDTPGLDSVYHRHRELTARYLPASDCFLLFLNGKHILTKPDLGIVRMIINAFSGNKASARKLFVAVNFADALTSREQEKVRNFLHENLIKPSAGAVHPDRIHFISALDALTGRERENFSRLINQLKDQIWESRCEDNYRQYLRAATGILDSIISRTAPETDTNNSQWEQFEPAVEKLLDEIGQNLAAWRAKIAAFNSPEDFRGLREGRQVVRKGLLGLSRKMNPVPSCRDLAGDINSRLARFHREWFGETGINISGFNAGDMERAIDQLLKSKFHLPEARNALCEMLTREESRIRDDFHRAREHWENRFKQPARVLRPNKQQSPELSSAVERHTAAIKELERYISSLGGISHGERQSAG